MQKPLDEWLEHNSKRILWFKTVKLETVIENCKSAIVRHKDPLTVSPDLLGCELLEAQANYKRLNERIIKSIHLNNDKMYVSSKNEQKCVTHAPVHSFKNPLSCTIFKSDFQSSDRNQH